MNARPSKAGVDGAEPWAGNEAESDNSMSPGRERWLTIGILVFGISTVTLQWYSLIPAFGGIGADFGLDLPELTLLVSVFFFGYAAAHIPVGFASALFGAKRVYVLGLLLLSVATVLQGVVGSYVLLLVLRTLAGVGAAVVLGVGVQLAAGWARDKERTFVLGGLFNAIGFSVGAAIGLYVWAYVIEYLGWRSGLVIAGIVGGVATAAAALGVKSPTHIQGMEGGRLSRQGVRASLGSRNIWGISLGSLGAYAGFFTISQIGPTYAKSELGLSATAAGLLGAVILLAGIPGGLLGGVVSDRSPRFLPNMTIPSLMIIILLFLLPIGGAVWAGIVMGVTVFLFQFAFSSVISAAAEYDEIAPEDIATAFGLILLMGNVGAFIDPIIYGALTEWTNATFGWWAVAAVAAIFWGGYLLAREPRRGRLKS